MPKSKMTLPITCEVHGPEIRQWFSSLSTESGEYLKLQSILFDPCIGMAWITMGLESHNLSPTIKCDSDLPQKESECGVGLFHGEPELVGHGLELELLLADLAAKCCAVLVARLLRE